MLFFSPTCIIIVTATMTMTTMNIINVTFVAPEITSMVLDMDIYKNEPKVISTKCLPNPQSWHGTVISVTVSGAWTYYKARILQYFQQLAVITPYANIEFDFQCISNSKKDFHLSFTRRSEQMPTTAREILPHPDSLNHITLNKLLMDSPHTNHSNGLYKFLTTELAGISPSVALKIIQNLIVNTASNSSELETLKVTNNTHIKPNSLSGKHITALSQILRDERQIKPPTHIMPTANNYSSNSCLSPVGKYFMYVCVDGLHVFVFASSVYHTACYIYICCLNIVLVCIKDCCNCVLIVTVCCL